MVWVWSHTVEAYQNVRDEIQKMERKDLEIIHAEWTTLECAEDEDIGAWYEAYEDHLSRAKMLADDVLADYICERTESQALCTNGGHYAWCCPYGCGPHCVPFGGDEDVKD